jgi:2-amino-4-hydroxy-6-hydroxymethyldihydropteridine diphosphokinase
LAACLDVEREMGRVRAERWGPRVIDLDILLYDREVIEAPDLRIPHPRMHERAFVLVPLLELVSDPMLPGGRVLSELRLGPGFPGGVRLFAPSL